MRYIDLLTFQTVLELPYAFYKAPPSSPTDRFTYAALPRTQGIYFVVHEHIMLYIGMTAEIRHRLACHDFRQYPKRFPFLTIAAMRIHFAAMSALDLNTIYAMEKTLIRRYKPLCNRTDVTNHAFHTEYAALRTNPLWLDDIRTDTDTVTDTDPVYGYRYTTDEEDTV